MSAVRVVIFDFDGVIVESVAIKTQAFRDLFAEVAPDLLERFIAFHLTNDGLSRYRKFEWLYEQLGEPLTEERSEELSRRFSELCVEAIKSCPFVPGAVEFLKRHHRDLALYVASGTPQAELQEIAAARGLTGYFRGVYGTPATKSEIVARVLAETGADKGDVVFIGDSLTDYTEAAKAGVAFVGRRKDDGPDDPMADVDAPVMRDLTELEGLV